MSSGHGGGGPRAESAQRVGGVAARFTDRGSQGLLRTGHGVAAEFFQGLQGGLADGRGAVAQRGREPPQGQLRLQLIMHQGLDGVQANRGLLMLQGIEQANHVILDPQHERGSLLDRGESVEIITPMD